MKRTAGIGAVLLVAVLLGAVREFFFINLNYAIDYLENHRPYSYAHSSFTAAITGLSLGDIILLKWAAGMVFIAAMLVLTIAMARVLFGDDRYRRMLTITTLTVGALAFMLHFAASVHPAFGLVSVKLLHMLQYPGILLFLWAASMLRKSPA